MGINQELIKKVTENQFKTDIPEFRTGDTIRIHVKIKEGDKERIQMFEGFVLKTAGTGNSKTVTVRKESYGVGVERTFPINSPIVANIDLVKTAKVRQGRIYYMRDRKGKAARLKPDQKRK
jgi:large subunit ribosomal protein L19